MAAKFPRIRFMPNKKDPEGSNLLNGAPCRSVFEVIYNTECILLLEGINNFLAA